MVGVADDDLLEMLKDLNESGALNDTILILMADHGHRFVTTDLYTVLKIKSNLLGLLKLEIQFKGNWRNVYHSFHLYCHKILRKNIEKNSKALKKILSY